MKRKIKIFAVSIFITLILMGVLFVLGSGGITSVSTGLTYVTGVNPQYTSFTVTTEGPTYFFSHADVSLSITNAYAGTIENITDYEFSIDNSTWVKVPVSDTMSYTKIGRVPLSGFAVPIYEKAIANFQNQTVPVNDIITSFHAKVSFGPVATTPVALLIFILLGIVIFSFVLQILDFWTKND